MSKRTRKKQTQTANYLTLSAREQSPKVGSIVEQKNAILVKKQEGDSVDVFYTDQNGKVMQAKNTATSIVENQETNHLKKRNVLTEDFFTDEINIEVPNLSVVLKKDTSYKVSAYIISRCDEGTYMGLTNGEEYINYAKAERENKTSEWLNLVGENIEFSNFLFIDETGKVSAIFDFLGSEDTVYRGDYNVVFCKIEGFIRVKKDMKLGIILKSEEGENARKEIKRGSYIEIEVLC